jgi:hypothetical protein
MVLRILVRCLAALHHQPLRIDDEHLALLARLQ